MRRDEQGAALDADDDAPQGSLVDISGADTTEEQFADLTPLDRAARRPSAAPAGEHRTGPRQFLHEVNVEMRKVAWPSRAETINYSTVVLVTLAILMALIFGLDYVFTHLAGFLFNP
ncbi:MAG TPA: preprotein translocase subunit SecE [Acidimicrobiales bacterium]|nr:preprotein translocase subunit SecE [Acidimicrobiales bacterium]